MLEIILAISDKLQLTVCLEMGVLTGYTEEATHSRLHVTGYQ